MKKITALFMSIMLVFSFTACSNTPTDNGNSTTSSVSQKEEQASENNSALESDSSKSASSEATNAAGTKTLVVYFSASGNTECVANDIAEASNADLFEIEPQQPYTDDDLNWSNSDSRVSREHDDESLRDVPLKTTEVSGWDSYDTVIIGYPIWWGIAAWPVDNFVKENDFSGKTVIPFATSASSGMGESGTLLADMAGTGDWQEGHRFSSSDSEETVNDWVAELNLNQ